MCVKCQSLTPCVVHFIHILLRMLVKDVSDKEWNFGGLETLIAENIKTAEQRTTIQQYADWYIGR